MKSLLLKVHIFVANAAMLYLQPVLAQLRRSIEAEYI